jgi:hypothetical protein
MQSAQATPAAPAPRTPTAASSVGEDAVLLRLIYDATGLQTIAIQSAPLVGWVFDVANPLTPGTTPVGIANMGPMPPATAPIVSPRWACAYIAGGEKDAAVFTENEVWCGNFDDFLLWLATNNGASRTLSVQLATPRLKNVWNKFAQVYPQYVT